MTRVDPMRDYVETLESRLRAAAIDSAPAGGRRSVRPSLVAAVVVVLAVILLVQPWSTGRPGVSQAYGKPLVSRLEPMPVPASVSRGQMISAAIGDQNALAQARQIPAFGGVAYLFEGPRAWCLSAPDPAAADPDVERGVTCASAALMDRYGISLRLGSHYIAAIPQGVHNPTITEPDGRVRELIPSAIGVVTDDHVRTGSTIRLYASDGGERADHVNAG